MMKLFETPYNCVSCGRPKVRTEDDLCEKCKEEVRGGSTNMTPNQYQRAAMRTNDGKCSDRLKKALKAEDSTVKVGDLINGVMGLCGESGEVADYVKKAVFHNHPFDAEALKKELGDVCWYIAMICHALNIDLEDVMRGNIQKLRARYPEGFSEEASLHRDTSKE